MKPYALLLRGVNVGGKNKLPMADLRVYLEELGYSGVSTYIASGNALVISEKSAHEIKSQIEAGLVARFKLGSELIKVLVLSREQLQAVIDSKPKGFGEEPDKYHSDVIFLIDINSDEAMPVFAPRDGVDKVWQGDGTVYSQRLSAERTKSRLGKIVGTPQYKSMTIRSWGTVTKLLKMLDAL